MITDGHLDELKEIFVKHGVVLAYLFGSQAEGGVMPLSDIDLAVLFPYSVMRPERFDRQLRLISDCGRLFRRDDVDVVVLNDAPPLLTFEVVRHGKMLYEDPAMHPAVDFAVYAISRHADTRPFRHLHNQYLFARIRQRQVHHALPV